MIIELDIERAAFNVLKVRKKSISGRFPDFMVVGPQRTGTTWLSDKLSKHPEIFMSDPKEIFFFNRLGKAGASHSNFFDRLVNEKPRLTKRYINFAAKMIQIDLLQTKWLPADTLDWYLTFFNGRRVNKYANSGIFGEATASYFILSEEIIADILTLNPEIKIIVLIRNPVSRTWSHAKKDLMRATRRQLADITSKEIMDYCANDYMRECNAYIKHIRKWSAWLKPGHLHCNFYDALVENPNHFLQAILDFLGLSTDTRYLDGDLSKRINPTAKLQIPYDIQQFLIDAYGQNLAELEATYPGKVAH
jgi:hypothetical protein